MRKKSYTKIIYITLTFILYISDISTSKSDDSIKINKYIKISNKILDQDDKYEYWLFPKTTNQDLYFRSIPLDEINSLNSTYINNNYNKYKKKNLYIVI